MKSICQMTWNIGKNEHMKGFSDENGGKAIVSPFPANQGIFAQLILKNCKKNHSTVCKDQNHIIIFVPANAEIHPKRPVRLGVRTPGFHPGNRGSNPLPDAQKLADISELFAFMACPVAQMLTRG